METQNSWARGRHIKVVILTLLISLSGGAITTAFAIAAAKPNATATDELPNLIDKYPWVATLKHIQIVGPWIATHPLISAAIFGCVGGVAGAWGIAGKLHDRFLAAFNSDVFKPVMPAYRPDSEPLNSAFVVLPWLPGNGARATAWKALHVWLHKDQALREGFWLFSKPMHPLTMAVLTGRAGSGKSRMAYELARAASGGAAEKPPSVLSRLRDWFRFTFTPRQLDDRSRWDAGSLPPSALAVGRDRGLAEWRPRRPTLILLDDPGPGQTAQIWSTLQMNAPSFRHAVRLLVTNQTVPYDSGFAFSDTAGKNGGWTFHGSPTATPPIVLPVEAWFSETEARMLARRADMVGPAAAPQSDAGRSLHANLFRVTRGNPLLVQLAFEWVREKRNFEDVSADALSEARVERIFAALRLNGINGRDQFTALALATPTGGVRRDTLARLGLDKLPSNNELQACFPSDDTRGGEFPPIRPEMIADRFVDRVIQQFSIPPEQLIENGFKLAPMAMLRVLRRARPATSRLGTALVAMDARVIEGLDAVRYTLALAELTAVCRHDEWPRTTETDRAASIARAQDAIASLSPTERAAFRIEFAALLGTIAGVDPLATIRIAPALCLYVGATGEFGPQDFSMLAEELRLIGDWLVTRAWSLDATPYSSCDAIARLATEVDGLLRAEGSAIDATIALDLVQRVAQLDTPQGVGLLQHLLSTPAFAQDKVDPRLVAHLAGDEDARDDLFRLLNSLAQAGRLQTPGTTNAMVAACCVFVSLGKVGDFHEGLEAHAAYRQWAEWASDHLRRACEVVSDGVALQVLQLALLSEAGFWASFRIRKGGASTIDRTDEQVERLWEMLVSAFRLAQRVRHQSAFDVALFSESVALLATVGSSGKPSLSKAFVTLFDAVEAMPPKRNRAFLGRLQLAEIYASCVRNDKKCVARFEQSIFRQNKLYFEGFHELELEACRLAHISACELPELAALAKLLEGRMRRIIDDFATELSEHANVWARLE